MKSLWTSFSIQQPWNIKSKYFWFGFDEHLFCEFYEREYFFLGFVLTTRYKVSDSEHYQLNHRLQEKRKLKK